MCMFVCCKLTTDNACGFVQIILHCVHPLSLSPPQPAGGLPLSPTLLSFPQPFPVLEDLQDGVDGEGGGELAFRGSLGHILEEEETPRKKKKPKVEITFNHTPQYPVIKGQLTFRSCVTLCTSLSTLTRTYTPPHPCPPPPPPPPPRL